MAETKDASYDLNLLKSGSLTSVLQAEIERIILEGEFGPGARLNEKALADRFSVSRGPVREACRALAARGLVELVPNRGVFIREVSKEEAAELYDVRAALFGVACRLLAERITEAQLAGLRALLVRMEAAAQRRDIELYYPLNLEFHRTIVEAAGNAALAKGYRESVERLHRFRTRGIVHGGGFAVSNQEHGAIVDALASRDPRAAFEAGYGHVQQGKDRVLRQAAGADGTERPTGGTATPPRIAELDPVAPEEP